MAQFDNVTYTYYSDTLGRAVIPTEADFNALKLENIQLMKSWMPYVTEKEEGGIDKAVCLMIEVDYTDNQIVNGNNSSAINSESVNGHSVSYGSTTRTELERKNAKSTYERKIDKAKLFLSFDLGVR